MQMADCLIVITTTIFTHTGPAARDPFRRAVHVVTVLDGPVGGLRAHAVRHFHRVDTSACYLVDALHFPLLYRVKREAHVGIRGTKTKLLHFAFIHVAKANWNQITAFSFPCCPVISPGCHLHRACCRYRTPRYSNAGDMAGHCRCG